MQRLRSGHPRHAKVQQNEIRIVTPGNGDGFFAVARDPDAISAMFEILPINCEGVLIVVDEQNQRTSHVRIRTAIHQIAPRVVVVDKPGQSWALASRSAASS